MSSSQSGSLNNAPELLVLLRFLKIDAAHFYSIISKSNCRCVTMMQKWEIMWEVAEVPLPLKIIRERVREEKNEIE